MPGSKDGRTNPVFAISAPSAIDQTSALVPVTRCGMRSATITIRVTRARPGAARRARSAAVFTVGVVARSVGARAFREAGRTVGIAPPQHRQTLGDELRR